MMAMTEQAFLRSVPLLHQQGQTVLKPGEVFIVQNDRQVLIKYKIRPQIKLGAILLPQLQLQFSFENYTNEQCVEFFTQFKRVYQRGGG